MSRITELLRRDWLYFVSMVVFFALGIWLGLYLMELDPVFGEQVKNQILNKFSGMLEDYRGASTLTWIGVIWWNNFSVCFLSLCFGLLFPLIPVLLIFYNGVAIGLLQQMDGLNLSLAQFLLMLAPHGIFELPAVFIAAGLGVRLGFIPYRLMRKNKTGEQQPFFREYFRDLRSYAILIIFLLVVAAVVEITITPLLSQR